MLYFEGLLTIIGTEIEKIAAYGQGQKQVTVGQGFPLCLAMLMAMNSILTFFFTYVHLIREITTDA